MNLTRPMILVTVVLASTTTGAAVGQRQSIIDSLHNLSTGGPGDIRATSEEQVCIFCHAPHNSSPIQPLWNRNLPVSAYSVYSSNSLDALPGQPTGASKMCLSCHDGTIALGSVISRNEIIQMAAGITTLPPGASNLGTDLSDDHPISFKYDSGLVSRDPFLADPGQLPPNVRLDSNQELQCTTCHDVHDNAWGNFLVMNNDGSSLCQTCHLVSSSTLPPHIDCQSCHQPHTAPSGPYLLQRDRITNSCLKCHDGSDPNAADIARDLTKVVAHDTNSPVDPAEPIPGHVTCADCHDPHTMDPGSGSVPGIHPNFGDVSGVNASGSPILAAQFEYEVCFKCHADQNAVPQSYIPRRITQTNTRLEFATSAISYHPVEGPGKNNDVPSLRPGWNTNSLVYCRDCHGSDTSKKAGGSDPDGVHGSNLRPLLLMRYETTDFTPESQNAYALCYKCHDRDQRDGVLKDRSFKEHKKHIVNERAPCSVCHDAHGISSVQGSTRNNSHLINFDTTVVFPDPETGRLEFIDDGRFAGRCFLTCHGEDHSPEDY